MARSAQKSTASVRPPPYAEVEAKIPFSYSSEPRSNLVVQIQVWHHSSEGRNPANNTGFAALFRDLPAWEVVHFAADGITGPGSHDQYVPVEVRFQHRVMAYDSLGEGPMADVRQLFYKVAPQFIYQFFVKIGSVPHNVNIFPVGVPDEFSSRYTHAYNLNPLSIRVNELLVPDSVSTDDAQTWLRDAANTTANVLEILAAIVIVYLHDQADRIENDDDDRPSIRHVSKRARFLMSVNVPRRFLALRGLFEEVYLDTRLYIAFNRFMVPAATVQEALDTAAKPLLQYLRLASCMESRLLMLENKQALSDQDLYELVHDSQNAVDQLSALKQALRPLVGLLDRNYAAAVQSYRSARTKSVIAGAILGFAAAIAAVLLLSNPGGWAVCGVGLIGGFAGADLSAVVHRGWDVERGKAFGKRDRVKEFRLAVKQLDMYASQAHAAVAMVFCAQVMRKPLDETLPEHDRRAILASFGVDVNGMPSPVYREELIRSRLRPFREWNAELQAKLEAVLTDVDCELEDW